MLEDLYDADGNYVKTVHWSQIETVADIVDRTHGHCGEPDHPCPTGLHVDYDVPGTEFERGGRKGLSW